MIKIGIIDSGYCVNDKINIGNSINLNYPEIIKSESNYFDKIGHGTACINIIYNKAPNSVFYPVKIFEKEITTNVAKLILGIKWCINNNVNIINISLSIFKINNINLKKLKSICDEATRNNILIISAYSNNSLNCYPACFKNVFGIYAGAINNDKNFYIKNINNLDFIAKGNEQKVKWIDNNIIDNQGASLAASHFTGIIASFLEKLPPQKRSISSIKDFLLQKQLRKKPKILYSEKQLEKSNGVALENINIAKEFIEKNSWKNKIKNIKNALVLPVESQEIQTLLLLKEKINFSIKTIKTENKLIKEALVFYNPFTNDIEKINTLDFFSDDIETQNFDTIIIGDLNVIEQKKSLLYQKKIIDLAIKNKLNIISLFNDNNLLNNNFELKKNNILYFKPIISINEINEISKHYFFSNNNKVPIICVLSLDNSGFDFIIANLLKDEFSKLGYNTNDISTRTIGYLFDCTYTIPFDNLIGNIPINQAISSIQSIVNCIVETNSDIIICNCNKGIIPKSYSKNSHFNIISSIALLMAILPDVIVLTINVLDDISYIIDSINTIKGVCNFKKIIIIFVENKENKMNNLFEYTFLMDNLVTRFDKELLISFVNTSTNKYMEIIRKEIINYLK